MDAERCFVTEAEKHWGEIPDFQDLFAYIHTHDRWLYGKVGERIKDLTSAHLKLCLNLTFVPMMGDDHDPTRHPEIEKLRNFLLANPQFEDLNFWHLTPGAIGKRPPEEHDFIVQRAFTSIDEKINFEWRYILDLPPLQRISHLLVRGYPEVISAATGSQELGELYGNAIWEILSTIMVKSSITNDLQLPLLATGNNDARTNFSGILSEN